MIVEIARLERLYEIAMGEGLSRIEIMRYGVDLIFHYHSVQQRSVLDRGEIRTYEARLSMSWACIASYIDFDAMVTAEIKRFKQRSAA